MAHTESNTPYAVTVGMLIGLAILLFGVGTHSMAIQGVGGAVVVAGIIALALYLDRLPGEGH